VATAFAVDVPWDRVALATLWPSGDWSETYIELIVAVLGTTISPYLFFWQAAQEVEELRRDPQAKALRECSPDEGRRQLSRINTDTFIGMAFSNLVAFFIIVTTAATLHAHGVSEIQSAAQAAEALKPIAGDVAFACFALGIIGTGMLAVPVLAGSAAYAVAEMMGWQGSLEDKPRQAKGFYFIVTIATLVGAAIGFTTIDPIRLLVWSAVVNAFIAAPIMVALMIAASSRRVLGPHAMRGGLFVLGWLATLAMLTATAALIWSWLHNS